MVRVTLEERAALSRELAESHRRLAAHTITLAERMERDAELMDRGIDPFLCEVCGEHVGGGERRMRCEAHEVSEGVA